MNNLSNKSIVFSLLWKFIERTSIQISNFIISIILARILLPSDYGSIALLQIFITISEVISQSGLGTVLIQKNNVSYSDQTFVFTNSICISIIIYIIIFLLSPCLGKYLNINNFSFPLRILALELFITPFTLILNAILVKSLNFRDILISNLIASIISGIIGVSLALKNFGLYSLIIHHILTKLISLIIMEYKVKWIPTINLNIKSNLAMLVSGLKIMFTNLISTSFNEIRSIAITSKYNINELAYYEKGKQIPQLLINNVNLTISSVMLPIFSSKQNNNEDLKNNLSVSIVLSTFLIFPIFGFFIISSKNIILLLLTEKWLPSLPFFIINILFFSLSPIQIFTEQIIIAKGKNTLLLKNEILKKIIGVIILLLSIFCFDKAVYIAYGGLLIGIISLIINQLPMSELINYNIFNLFNDVFPNLLLSIITNIITYHIKYIITNVFVLLIVQFFFCIFIYIIFSYFFKTKGSIFVINLLMHK